MCKYQNVTINVKISQNRVFCPVLHAFCSYVSRLCNIVSRVHRLPVVPPEHECPSVRQLCDPRALLAILEHAGGGGPGAALVGVALLGVLERTYHDLQSYGHCRNF